jgi:hypothetical protein
MSEMDKLPGNSKTVPAVRNEQRAVRTVAKGKVLNSQKKTGLFGRVKDAFSGEDMDNMGTNIVEDIIIPTAFNAFLNSLGAIGDGIMGAFELALFPDSNRRGRRRRSYGGGYDYAGRYRSERRRVDIDDDRDRPRGRELGRRERETHNFDSIGYPTKEAALDVLEEMVDWLEEYGECPVKVYYSASGVSANAQDLYWGWTSLANAKPVRVSDPDYPWRLMLAKPVYLNDRRK